MIEAPGTVRQGSFQAHCRVCRDLPSRWRVAKDQPPFFEYYCERHETNKDMRLAELAGSGPNADLVELAHGG